jgi:hypothetical protein
MKCHTKLLSCPAEGEFRTIYLTSNGQVAASESLCMEHAKIAAVEDRASVQAILPMGITLTAQIVPVGWHGWNLPPNQYEPPFPDTCSHRLCFERATHKPVLHVPCDSGISFSEGDGFCLDHAACRTKEQIDPAVIRHMLFKIVESGHTPYPDKMYVRVETIDWKPPEGNQLITSNLTESLELKGTSHRNRHNN